MSAVHPAASSLPISTRPRRESDGSAPWCPDPVRERSSFRNRYPLQTEGHGEQTERNRSTGSPPNPAPPAAHPDRLDEHPPAHLPEPQFGNSLKQLELLGRY